MKLEVDVLPKHITCTKILIAQNRFLQYVLKAGWLVFNGTLI